MKTITNIKELLVVEDVVDMYLIVDDLRPVMVTMQHRHDSFEEILGGNVHILENFNDFARVTFWEPDTGRTRNLLCDYGQFDIFEEIGKSGIYKVLTITSNSGGAMYYIPRALACLNPFVALSAEETN
jgi:hypothetical protein